MAEQLIVPKLGMAAAEVTLTEWKTAEGGWVQVGDEVLEIEAEKSSFGMTAPASGYLHIVTPEGSETDVNTVVGLIAATAEEYAALSGSTAAAPAADDTAPAAVGDLEPDVPAIRVVITPVARRIAREHDIDPATLIGSGPRGRVQKRDVEQAVLSIHSAATEPTRPPAPQPARHPVPVASPETEGRSASRMLPYSGMRRAIGENMMRSLADNAPNTMSGDFDLSVMVRYRTNFLANQSRLGARITFSDMLIHAVAKALKQFPMLNSSLIDSKIMLWDAINIGMAVALGEHGEEGLLVPVIEHADRLSLVELSRKAKGLGERARSRTVTPEETTGGTFTVTNFGSLGVSAYSTPIINPPESAIIGFGRLAERPVVRDGGIRVAPMLPYSLTHDHRIIDGAAAEAFLGCLKQIVENPQAELSEIALF